MSRLERRLQILLDNDRYDRVEAEATASGRSVAAVIREAIDLRFRDDASVRALGARDFLASVEADERPEPDWADTKAALHLDLGSRVSGA